MKTTAFPYSNGGYYLEVEILSIPLANWYRTDDQKEIWRLLF